MLSPGSLTPAPTPVSSTVLGPLCPLFFFFIFGFYTGILFEFHQYPDIWYVVRQWWIGLFSKFMDLNRTVTLPAYTLTVVVNEWFTGNHLSCYPFLLLFPWTSPYTPPQVEFIGQSTKWKSCTKKYWICLGALESCTEHQEAHANEEATQG